MRRLPDNAPAPHTASVEGLHDRLAAAAGDRTYRALAELTGTNAETARRYMQGQAPSVEFVTALCDALAVNAHWLITGQGPMRTKDMRAHALRDAGAGELLTAVATALESLTTRVDRIETYVHTMETRLRAAGESPEPSPPPPPPPARGARTRAKPKGAGDGSPTRSRARRVADALPKRPRPNAD